MTTIATTVARSHGLDLSRAPSPRMLLWAASAAALMLSQAACNPSLTPQQAAMAEARLGAAVAAFRTGCIDQAPEFAGSIRTFERAGLSQRSVPQTNVEGVYSPERAIGAFVSNVSVPGYDFKDCTIVIDAISQPSAAATWYALSGDYFGTGRTRGPSNIRAGGQLPRYKPDGSFEALYFETGPNLETGNPAMLLGLSAGRTTLPLRELANGRLLPAELGASGGAGQAPSR